MLAALQRKILRRVAHLLLSSYTGSFGVGAMR